MHKLHHSTRGVVFPWLTIGRWGEGGREADLYWASSSGMGMYCTVLWSLNFLLVFFLVFDFSLAKINTCNSDSVYEAFPFGTCWTSISDFVSVDVFISLFIRFDT